jgi:hypothetical protein
MDSGADVMGMVRLRIRRILLRNNKQEPDGANSSGVETGTYWSVWLDVPEPDDPMPML